MLDGDPAPRKGAQPPIFDHGRCGPTAGWIEMPLGTEVGLVQGHFVLDGDLVPPKRGTPPIFGLCLLWPNGWMDQDATWYGASQKEARPQFSAHVYCSQTVAHLSYC